MMRIYFLLVVLLIGFDQSTKIIITEQLEIGESILINTFFNLTHVHNYGAAFSLFSQGDIGQRYFLSLVSIIVSIVIIVCLLRTKASNRIKRSALSLILAGAIGNLIDRVFLGFVVDFISLHYQNWYFPVFNIADASIFLGVVLLIISDRHTPNTALFHK